MTVTANPAFERTRRLAQFFLGDAGGGGPLNLSVRRHTVEVIRGVD